MTEQENLDQATQQVTEIRAGYYQHYKGPLYLVLGAARDSETGELKAVYIPLYQHEGPGMATRRLSMFFENVTIEGVEQPRFRYLGLMSSMGEVGKS